MRTLYVLYDAECELCRRVRVWLGRQPVYVKLTFIPLQSEEVGCRFPGIETLRPEEQLLVISDRGDVWRGEKAWITVLWALREFREWSFRLSRPSLQPVAARFCTFVSERRHNLPRWLTGGSDAVLRMRLDTAAPSLGCGTAGYCKPR